MDTKTDLGLALPKVLCPICCKEMDGPILLGTRFSKKNAEKINSMDRKVIGFNDKPCPDCQKLMDEGCFFIIGIDIEKSEPNNPYRSGHIVGLKNTSEFVKHLDEKYKERNAIMMDYKEMIKFGMINEQSNRNI